MHYVNRDKIKLMWQKSPLCFLTICRTWDLLKFFWNIDRDELRNLAAMFDALFEPILDLGYDFSIFLTSYDAIGGEPLNPTN